MTEQMGVPEDRKYPAMAFLRRRLATTTPSTVASVEQILRNSKSLKETFLALWQKLEGSKKVYTTVVNLRRRDNMVREIEGTVNLQEDYTLKSARLARPDQGRSSPLEYWLFTLLSPHRLEEIMRETEEREPDIKDSGGLSFQSAIENVLADEPRTKALIAAVRERVRSFNNRPANIYYVGCGPFPILAIAAALESKNADITCIEINPLSAAIARELLGWLDKTGAIRSGKTRVIEADALTLPIPPDTKIDLVISETASAGLFDEQIAKLMEHFAPHLSESGVLLPSKVKLSAALTPTSYKKALAHARETGRTDEYGLVITASGNEVLVQPERDWHSIGDPAGIIFGKPIEKISGTVPIPPEITIEELERGYCLSVCAELVLDTSGQRILRRYQSLPTSPVVLGFPRVPPELREEPPSNLEIYFEYQPGSPSDRAQKIQVRKRS